MIADLLAVEDDLARLKRLQQVDAAQQMIDTTSFSCTSSEMSENTVKSP